MTKRLTLQYIKNKTRELAEDYICLSKEYIGVHIKLKFKCPRGHIFRMNWNNFQQGQRCPYCYGNKKKTIEEIKEYIEKAGYKSLSKKYKNNRTKLKFKCPKGHIFKTIWRDFYNKGSRCPICYQENRWGEIHPNWKNYSEEDIKNIENYESNVEQLTNQNFHKYYYLINPNNLKRGKDYHLDHIYTIIDGFKNNILPEIVASPINLQMLTAFDNISKHSRSDMTKEILYDLYNQFEKVKND